MIEVPVALLLFLLLLGFVAGVRGEARRDRYRRSNDDTVPRLKRENSSLREQVRHERDRVADLQRTLQLNAAPEARFMEPEEAELIVNGYGEVVKTVKNTPAGYEWEAEWKICPPASVTPSTLSWPLPSAAVHPQPLAPRQWRGLFVEIWEAFKAMVETMGIWMFGPELTDRILHGKPEAKVKDDPAVVLLAELARIDAEIAEIGPPDPSVFRSDKQVA